jgi:hypothetical protein
MNKLCKLDNLPIELRKVIIKKLRWYKEDIHTHSEGIDFICPYNSSHRTYHKYSEYFGMEIVYCGSCGYRYVGQIIGGVYQLVNYPEVKHKQLVVRRSK